MKTHRRSDRKPAPALEWLCDITGKTARITSIGGTALLVENHRGLIAYESDRIELQTGCGSVVITGSQLTLSDVRKDALIVRGEIRNVQLPCGDVHAAP